MCGPTELMVTSLIASTLIGGYSVVAQQNAQDEASDAAARAAEQQKAEMERQTAALQAQADALANQAPIEMPAIEMPAIEFPAAAEYAKDQSTAINVARTAQKQKAMAAKGVKSTMVTGPTGLATTADTTKKTLLSGAK